MNEWFINYLHHLSIVKEETKADLMKGLKEEAAEIKRLKTRNKIEEELGPLAKEIELKINQDKKTFWIVGQVLDEYEDVWKKHAFVATGSLKDIDSIIDEFVDTARKLRIRPGAMEVKRADASIRMQLGRFADEIDYTVIFQDDRVGIVGEVKERYRDRYDTHSWGTADGITGIDELVNDFVTKTFSERVGAGVPRRGEEEPYIARYELEEKPMEEVKEIIAEIEKEKAEVKPKAPTGKGLEYIEHFVETSNRTISNPYLTNTVEIICLRKDEKKVAKIIEKWDLDPAGYEIMAQAPSFAKQMPDVASELTSFQFFMGDYSDLKSSGYDIKNILTEVEKMPVIASRSRTVRARLF